jgi:predicted acetyltransferase
MGDEIVSEYFHDLWGNGVNRKSMGGSMMRVVDARKALDHLPFSVEIDDSITIKIHDEYAPWNNEPFELNISRGVGTTQDHDGPVDLEIDIRGFSQLLVGFSNIHHLLDHRIAKASMKKVSLLGHVFPKRTTRTLTEF